ncbi:RloB-like protein [Marivirga sericea]|uniref:RloB-like protein n=1 Tax=Marivirga sericea TaxID=1028 RepID=A0A1X7JC70_9BACT|nr:RloB family protein [Marivirga sericea]SMG25246.1 RloB-like protein [Marivirga sericea]
MPKPTKSIKKTDQSKAWNRKKRASSYQIETREVNKVILIVTEGQTEQLYFKSFPVLTLTVEAIDLGGQSKTKLIQVTEDIVENSATKYDEIWCVFDMDIKHGAQEFSDFDNGITSGKAKGYNIAYSNDCFDLWFYLHYHYSEQSNHREFYYDFLSNAWGCNYVKEGKKYNFCNEVFNLLEKDEDASQFEAINRARKLFEKTAHLPYHDQNPVTMVYELVELLNENCRK